MNYRQISAVSHSFLKALRADSQKAYDQYIAKTLPMDQPTASMRWGTAFEQFLWGDRCVEIPSTVLNRQGHRKGKSWIEFSAENEGKILLTEAEINVFVLCARHLADHPHGCPVIAAEDGETWKVLQWTDAKTGLPCKAELDRVSFDGFGEPIIGDLKTAQASDADSFCKQAWNLSYFSQAAWYIDGFREVTGQERRMVFVVIKNSPSYSVETYRLDEGWIQRGRERNRKSLDRYADCLSQQNFKSATHDELQVLEAPRYARYEFDYVFDNEEES